jgi:hypothetical protein
VYEPKKSEQLVYDGLYSLYSKLYFAFGGANKDAFAEVLPTLIRVAESARRN